MFRLDVVESATVLGIDRKSFSDSGRPDAAIGIFVIGRFARDTAWSLLSAASGGFWGSFTLASSSANSARKTASSAIRFRTPSFP